MSSLSQSIRQFRLGTRIVAGIGAIRSLASEIERVGAQSVVVVVDAGAAGAGVLAHVPSRIGTAEIHVGPPVDMANAAVVEAVCRDTPPGVDCVVAIGGGTALSVGKAVALRLSNDVPIMELVGRGGVGPPLACIAVPTTAGSGGEVSSALVLHEPDMARNVVIRGDGFEPDVAILDGELVRTLPDRPLQEAALDAISHALEALWARGSGFFSDCCALAAVREIRLHLPTALAERDPGAMQRLLEASSLANVACGNAGLALVHALSSAPLPMPHGYVNGVLLLEVAELNWAHLNAPAREEVQAVRELYASLRAPKRFQPGEVGAAEIEMMIRAALGHPGLQNNLRSVGAEDLRTLLEKVA